MFIKLNFIFNIVALLMLCGYLFLCVLGTLGCVTEEIEDRNFSQANH